MFTMWPMRFDVSSVCLFVCLFFVPRKNFSLIWRRHYWRWRSADFDLCSALMAIEQLGFFNVPHLLWHGASFYNGHLRGPVTLTPIAEPNIDVCCKVVVIGTLSTFQRVDKWYSWICVGISCRCAIRLRNFHFIPRGQIRFEKWLFLFSVKFVTWTLSAFSIVDNWHSLIWLGLSCRCAVRMWNIILPPRVIWGWNNDVCFSYTACHLISIYILNCRQIILKDMIVYVL